jgi:uncharacterized membrane protein
MIHYGIIYFLLVAINVAHPWISRKNVLFGVVFGDTMIWQNKSARAIIRRFVISILILIASIAAVFLLFLTEVHRNEANQAYACLFSILAFLILSSLLYFIANRRVRKLKELLPQVNLYKGKITVEISEDVLKRSQPISNLWFILLLVPIALTLILTMIYYPGKLMTPVLNQIRIAAVLFVMNLFIRQAPASVKGNPSAAPKYPEFRKAMSIYILGVGIVVESMLPLSELRSFGMVGNMKMMKYSDMLFAIALIMVTLYIYFKYFRSQNPSGPVYDDDHKWVLGYFYYNPADSSLFIEKRGGIGYTINFGRPAAWSVLAVLIAVIIIFRAK